MITRCCRLMLFPRGLCRGRQFFLQEMSILYYMQLDFARSVPMATLMILHSS